MNYLNWKRGLMLGGTAAFAALPLLLNAGDGKKKDRADRSDHGPGIPNVRSADKDNDGSVTKDEFNALVHETMFSRMDSNADGKIDDTELTHMEEMRDQARERYSRPEGRRPEGPPPGGPGAKPPFPGGPGPDGPPPAGEGPEFGPDGVTPKAPRPEFRERQRGGDITAFQENLEISQLIVKELDANADGKIGKDEAPERVAAAFEKLDTNKDGLLDAADAGVKRKMKEREQGGRAEMGKLLEKMDANKDGKVDKSEAPPKLAERFDTLDKNADGALDQEEFKAMRPEGPGRPGKKGDNRKGEAQPNEAPAEAPAEKPAV